MDKGIKIALYGISEKIPTIYLCAFYSGIIRKNKNNLEAFEPVVLLTFSQGTVSANA